MRRHFHWPGPYAGVAASAGDEDGEAGTSSVSSRFGPLDAGFVSSLLRVPASRGTVAQHLRVVVAQPCSAAVPRRVAVVLAVGFAISGCAAWLGHSNMHLRHTVEMEEHFESKIAAGGSTWVQAFPSKCGKTDEDVEYQDTTNGWGKHFDHIKTPELCCSLCQGNPKCWSFTWVKDAGLAGCPSQCWLKGAVGNPVRKIGFVSGVPPPRRQLPPVPSGAGGPGGSLWCFALMQPAGYERSMLRWQHDHKASIFACDGYAVYSNESLSVAPGVVSSVVDSNLKCNFGGDSGTALNAWIFIAVWKKIVDDGAYRNFDWVVKVDPDAVFFPDRLGLLLRGQPKVGYLLNCKYGLHGPIEVFSTNAVNALAADYGRSWDKKAPKTCVEGLKSKSGLWGEDMFLDQCFQKILKVTPRTLQPTLMCEDHCECPAWYWCQNGTDRVSFHPFKTPYSYAVCMANALGGQLPVDPSQPVSYGARESSQAAAGSVTAATPMATPAKSGTAAAETVQAVKAAETVTQAPTSAFHATAAVPATPCVDAVLEGGAVASGQAKCVKEVRWARLHGIYEHKEWYKGTGLTGNSPFHEFQQWLHDRKDGKCPRPCKGAKKAVAQGAAVAGKTAAGTAAGTVAAGTSTAAGTSIEPAALPTFAVASGTAGAGGAPLSDPPPPTGPAIATGPLAQTFYMYRAQSNASYPMENINTADLAGVMWYLHNEVVRTTPRKYAIDRIRRYKVTVKNTPEFWNVHRRQFGAFVAYDAARCSTPVCKDIYHQYGFIVGCQKCDAAVANYLAKSQTNWNCKKGSDQCRAPLWYSLPGPCPSMGMSNKEIEANKVGLDVMKAKTPDCIKRMPGGHCDGATGAPDCTYSYEEAGEIFLDELTGIGDYDTFWNKSFVRCQEKKARRQLPASTRCIRKKEYVGTLDKGVGCSFWDGIHDEKRCTDRMNAVRALFKKHYPQFPASLPEPPCEFDMYYKGEFQWPINHTGALPSTWWLQRM